jgi:hypothetical protein
LGKNKKEAYEITLLSVFTKGKQVISSSDDLLFYDAVEG